MPEALKWDQVGTRTFESGVDHCVLYPQVGGKYPKGVAWSGISSIAENPTGAEPNKIYADNMNYLTLMSAEEYEGSITAYTYPDEWAACDGSATIADGVTIGQQERQAFGLAYRTKVGNDTKSEAGYKLHLVYGAVASPSDQEHETQDDDPDADEMSWDFTTTPVSVPGYKAASTITLDSTKVDAEKLAALEKILFGSSEADAKLPDMAEVISMFKGTVADETPEIAG